MKAQVELMNKNGSTTIYCELPFFVEDGTKAIIYKDDGKR